MAAMRAEERESERPATGRSASVPKRIARFLFTPSPPRIAIAVFSAVILFFTVLLMLPISSAHGRVTNFFDALFTATSAVCVTGLTTVDMARQWSAFGNVTLLVGMEVGAVGVLTMASLLGMMVSRRLGLRARLIAASDQNPMRMHSGPVSETQAVSLGDVGGVLRTVVISVLSIETVLSIVIFPRLLMHGNDLGTAAWHSIYFATSAFTNTGFVPDLDGMNPFRSDLWMLGAIAAGVVMGSLGFPVLFALRRLVHRPRRLPLHAKLTLVTTTILIVVGAFAIYLLELGNPETIAAEPWWLQPITATFMSIMTRSGGFSTIDIDSMHGSTQLVLDMLVFVGGGSASTAGGIKVTTLAVLFLAAFAEARGSDGITVFHRRIPDDVLRIAVSIVLWGGTIVAVASIAIMQISGQPLNRVLFDTISAFGTCGLSTGLAEQLPDSGKLILTITMWAGRVGTVTLAAALASTERKSLFRLPEERPIVG